MDQEQLAAENVQATEEVAAQDERRVLMGQLVDSANARAAMYRLVAVLATRNPEGPVVGSLASMIKAENAVDDGLISQGFRDIAGYLANLDTANILDLLVDYGLAIENLPSGVSTSGMELARNYLGSGCDSMGLLCQREAEMLQMGDLGSALRLFRVQSTMYGERFETWVPAFCDKVEPEINTAYYKGAMKLLRGFIVEEKLYIEDSIGAIEELMAESAAESEQA